MLEKWFYESKPALCVMGALLVHLKFDNYPSWGKFFVLTLAAIGLTITYQRMASRGLIKAHSRE